MKKSKALRACTFLQKTEQLYRKDEYDLNIAILGFGTVGSGIYEILKKNGKDIAKRVGEEINVKYILDIRDFSSHEDAHLFTNDYNVILNDSTVNIVAEVIGGVEPSLTFTREALCAGKHVVTSNKELVATHGDELFKIAAENNAAYLFEAAVGGGIPLIRPLYNCLAANHIQKITGVLNGTTNYILTQMIAKGRDFDSALKSAQDNGYAERDPSADIEGKDTARKISILSSLMFGSLVSCDHIETEGITGITMEDVKYAETVGCDIKLIGYSEIETSKVFARVSPMLISKENPISCASDVYNAVLAKGDSVGNVLFYGKGAGKLPTASAVLGDIIDIARHKNVSMSWSEEKPGSYLSDDEVKTGAFVRISALDDKAFTGNYKNAIPVDAHIPSEKAYIIQSVTESEFKNIKCIKKIRTEENFIPFKA